MQYIYFTVFRLKVYNQIDSDNLFIGQLQETIYISLYPRYFQFWKFIDHLLRYATHSDSIC